MTLLDVAVPSIPVVSVIGGVVGMNTVESSVVNPVDVSVTSMVVDGTDTLLPSVCVVSVIVVVGEAVSVVSGPSVVGPALSCVLGSVVKTSVVVSNVTGPVGRFVPEKVVVSSTAVVSDGVDAVETSPLPSIVVSSVEDVVSSKLVVSTTIVVKSPLASGSVVAMTSVASVKSDAVVTSPLPSGNNVVSAPDPSSGSVTALLILNSTLGATVVLPSENFKKIMSQVRIFIILATLRRSV